MFERRLKYTVFDYSVGMLCACSQSGGASQRADGWSWVDGTSAANLNCGSGAGGDGCGLWNTGEPKYVLVWRCYVCVFQIANVITLVVCVLQ